MYSNINFQLLFGNLENSPDWLWGGQKESLEVARRRRALLASLREDAVLIKQQRRHFFVRELIERMELRVPYVNTADNIADFFTKPLEPRVFRAMRDVIMNVPSVSH